MTPQLRFPEFTDVWQVKKLGDYIKSFDAGVSVNSDDNRAGGGELAILKTSCVTRGIFDYRENKRVVELRETKRLKEPVTKDTIIISRMNTPELVGANAYVDQSYDSIYLPDRLWATKMYENCSTRFIAYKLGSKQYRQKLSSIATGTSNSMKNISKESVRQLEIVAPSKPEQEKIADFLTAVDARIAVSEKKLELLETYKRGVMQQIFSQKIRFKDENGNEYPEWEERKVADFLHERKEYAKKDGSYEHISLTTKGVVPKSERYERDFLVGSEDKKYRITKIDDICYNPANLKFGVIARNKYKQGIFSPIYVTYEVRGADVGFVEYMVTRGDFIQYARRFEEGTVYERMAVGPSDLATLTVRMPVIEEQQKIATFLTALDDKITAEKSKLTAAKQFKKALLQRMFV